MADVLGFDVSKWQAGAYSGGGGFAFGIAKLTEGIGYKDDAADRHMAAILAQPIVPGGYHFGRPDLNPGTSGAHAEADWFWAIATSYGGALGMLLALDAESQGGSLQWCDDFTGRLAWRAGGLQALFYSYWAWMTSRGIPGSDLLTRSALWLAWPDANGQLPGVAVSMQQYGLTSVPGISGSVDADRFFGSIDQLKELTLGGDSFMSSGPLADAGAQQRLLDSVARLLGIGADGVQHLDNGQPVPATWSNFLAAMVGQIPALNAKADALLKAEGVAQAAIDAIAANGAAASAVAALATSQAALKAELDQVAGDVASGQPPNLTALSQAVAANGAGLINLGKHLGVDVTTGQPS